MDSRSYFPLLVFLTLALCPFCPALHAESSGSAGDVVDLTTTVQPVPSISTPKETQPLALVVEGEPVSSPGAPQAALTSNGEFVLGNWVQLDASQTVSLDNDPLEFKWRQALGASMGLSPQEMSRPALWLYLSTPGEYSFIVRAKNKNGWSLPAEKRFQVNADGGNGIPAHHDARKLAGAGELIRLPGTAWRQLDGPRLELRVNDRDTTFRPIRAGVYIFESGKERRGIIVPPAADQGILGDRRPIAKVLTRSPSGQPHKPVLLDGSLSRDPDGTNETQALKARWASPDKERGIEIKVLPGLKARFVAPRPGIYCVEFSVSDGRLESEPEKIFVRIESAPANSTPTDDENWQEVPEQDKDDIRYRKVSLGLWASLDRAVQMFPSRCGAALRVDSEIAPPEKLETVSLNLEVMNGPLIHLLNWIARQTDSCYRRQPESFWFTRPMGWAKDEKLEPITVLVDALYSKPDGSDLMVALKPAFQSILDNCEGTTFTFTQNRQEIFAVLPSSACKRLKDICAVLRAPGIGGLPLPEIPTPSELNLRKNLAEKTISISANRKRVDFLLRDMAQIAGVAMAMDPRQFPDGIPKIDVNLQNAPLRDAVRTVVDLAGFDGCSAEAPAGLWFYKGSAPYPSGEMLWDHAQIRAYDLTTLLKRIDPLSGEAVAHLVQSRIYPESWKDPGALCFYHPGTKRLVVIHGNSAHNKILEFLFDLADRGEWALGPSE